MRKLILILALLPGVAFSKQYRCQFNSEQGIQGSVDLKVGRSLARTNINIRSTQYSYYDCEVSRDDFGTLVDCGHGNLDLMILLNTQGNPATGGIMSSTHDLFADIDC